MVAKKQDVSQKVANVRPKTDNQAVYHKALRKGTVTICSGPAGTGKTYLACDAAFELLKDGKVEKILLVRPLVTCGSKEIGTLPGELEDKIGPYMRPLVEAFEDIVPKMELNRLIQKGVIELVPLEFMRGKTVKGSYVICDEAQNAEYVQLHMLLTRIGRESRFVITGDASQTDLPNGGINALTSIIKRFRGGTPREIQICYLERSDIQRHPLIQWMDERLSGSGPAEDECQVSSIHCTECSKRMYYELKDAGGFDVEQVECWNCKAVLDMSGDVIELDDIKIPACLKSHESCDF